MLFGRSVGWLASVFVSRRRDRRAGWRFATGLCEELDEAHESSMCAPRLVKSRGDFALPRLCGAWLRRLAAAAIGLSAILACTPTVPMPSRVVRGSTLVLSLGYESALGVAKLTPYPEVLRGQIGYGGVELANLATPIWDDLRGWVVVELTDANDPSYVVEIPARYTSRVALDSGTDAAVQNGFIATFGANNHQTSEVVTSIDIPSGIRATTYNVQILNRRRNSESVGIDCDPISEADCEETTRFAYYNRQIIVEDGLGTPTPLDTNVKNQLARLYPYPKVMLALHLGGSFAPTYAARVIVNYPKSKIARIVNVYADHAPRGDTTLVWSDDGNGNLTIDFVNPLAMAQQTAPFVSIAFDPVPKRFGANRIAPSDFAIVSEAYYKQDGSENTTHPGWKLVQAIR